MQTVLPPRALVEGTGRQEQVESILSPEGSFPGPWFSAYLLGKDGICLQPPHHSSTSSPTHRWWYESLTLLEACPGISSEVRWAVFLTPLSLLPHPQDRGFSYGEVRTTTHEQSDGPTAHYTCKVTEGGG